MSLFSDITGAITGAGSIAEAVSGVAKAVQQALGMAQAKEQRDEGATAQRESDDQQTLDTLKEVVRPITDADRDRVWNKYAPKPPTS